MIRFWGQNVKGQGHIIAVDAAVDFSLLVVDDFVLFILMCSDHVVNSIFCVTFWSGVV